MQQGSGLDTVSLWQGYMAILLVALARQDGVAGDAISALLERVVPQFHKNTSLTHSIVAAYSADDPMRFDLDGLDKFTWGGEWIWILLYFAEHNLPAPDSLIEAVRPWRAGGSPIEALAETSEALTSGDAVRLAAAIDAAEARHLVVHAARMRIVLAQRTSDPTLLERARPVLEQLGDREFLRRLEEVRAALQ